MCGIVGYSGSKDKSFNIDKIKLLVYWNQERGKDSLGFFTPKGGIVKELGKAEVQMSKTTFNIPESNNLIVHLRAATSGVVNVKNAHPFQYDNIVLAMNGTISNQHSLCLEYDLKTSDYDVDSQVVAAVLAKTQKKDVLGKVNGGCAVVYYDTVADKMYCYRNSERPLFRGSIDGCMYISSIEASLKVIGCINVKEFKTDYLYEIENGKITFQSLVPKPKITPVKASSYFDTEEKYSYTVETLYNTPLNILSTMWLVPDNTSVLYGIKKGFGYKCIGQNKTCSKNDITIINDLGNQVNVSRTSFMYRKPIIEYQSWVFATCKLVRTTSETVFCECGDLLKVTYQYPDEKTFTCKNFGTGAEVVVEECNIRFGHKAEVDDYFRRYYTIFKKDLETDANDEYPANPNLNENNSAQKHLTGTEKFKFDLYSIESSETYEEHVDFCVDNIEDQIADLEQINAMSKSAKEKISNIKCIIDYYKDMCDKHYFTELLDDDDDAETDLIESNNNEAESNKKTQRPLN